MTVIRHTRIIHGVHLGEILLTTPLTMGAELCNQATGVDQDGHTQWIQGEVLELDLMWSEHVQMGHSIIII